MPEFPEVELLKRGLSKYIVGLVIKDIEVKTAKVVEGNIKKVRGRVVGVRRFGKMLAIDLNNGCSLAVHVKMTGRLIYRGQKQPKDLEIEEELKSLPNKHTHVVFTFTNGDKLYYNDVRRFGWIKVVSTENVKKLPFVEKLGPEPFSNLDVNNFYKIISKYNRPIKTLLMDQERISGVGNIYANEALFCAGIRPDKKAERIAENESRRLFDCILKVLREGMQYGGSSTDAFRNVLGQKGEYQEHYYAYDREGQRCKRTGCSGTIKKLKLGGRGTYYCPICQK